MPLQIYLHFADDNEMFRDMIHIFLKFVAKDQIDNKSSLVQVMTSNRTGGKPLPEPTMTQFSDAYMPHYALRKLQDAIVYPFSKLQRLQH